MNAITPLLEIDNLKVEIQSMPALRGFSMQAARGAMVSLVGRSRQDNADAFDHGSSHTEAWRRSI